MEDYAIAATAEQSALAAATEQELRVPYYCEENVWRLALRKRTQQPSDRFWTVFISNTIKNVPMFQQKAAVHGDVSCCWDYHVILLCQCPGDAQVMVYDVDSLLPYPCPLDTYLAHSFPYNQSLINPMFRVVPIDSFLSNFSSDRSHMKDKNGKYRVPPPSYAPILGAAGQHDNNLQEYLRFDQAAVTRNDSNSVYGQILSKVALASADFSTFP